jgi:pimeloyl-ACP methyl ester carboxylesterase
MSDTIVFIHGAWVTPQCWEKMQRYFQARGYTCLAPTWPHKDRPIDELRRTPPPALAGLGVTEIVDHFERIIRGLDKPPILIGHSFGGLFVQMLLDRGLGTAGVAIDPAPPRGVLPVQWSVYKSNAGILFTWRGWKKIVHMSFRQFRYAFVNTMSPAEQRAAYEQHVVPETGRIFFQAGFALLDPRRATRVNFQNATRAPLLLIQGGSDHVVAPGVVRSNFKKYRGSLARTDCKLFPGRCHWIIAQEGWEEVAEYIADWLRQLPDARLA